MCQSGRNEYDCGKPKSKDDGTLTHQVLGLISGFDVQWGEKLVH